MDMKKTIMVADDNPDIINIVKTILEGKGYTIIDGVRHNWEENEIILLPLKSHGVIHQHYNSDPNKPARLLVSEPNWVHVWGVDLGSGLEMLEPAPEFKG